MKAESSEVALTKAVRPAVSVRNVTKTFDRRFVRGGHTTFKTQLLQPFRRGTYKEKLARSKIEVLKGLSFDILPGETVGIIGRNGAGKSSLLKLLTGIYKPTSGTIEKNGRVSALLELGAGFHPEFSGRENIFMNGMILGLSKKELKRREQEIIDFSELGDFIDAPVRTYSSGMYMRLAFSIAVNVDPDILIIDEVLAVGDEHFQHKSKTKLDEFKKKSTAIILVTHDLGTVEQWCSRAIWLDEGRIGADGEPRAVIGAYRTRVAERESGATPDLPVGSVAHAPLASAPAGDGQASPDAAAGAVPDGAGAESAPGNDAEAATPAPVAKRWGNREVVIREVRMLGREGKETSVVDPESEMALELHFEASRDIEDYCFGVGIFRTDGVQVFGTNTQIDRDAQGLELPKVLPRRGVVRFEVARAGFIEANYLVDVACHTKNGVDYDYHKGAFTFAVRSEVRDVGVYRPQHRWELRDLATSEPS